MMVGDVLADRYELEEILGTGGMSTVYRARDRVLDRRVALKVLHQHFRDDDEYVERFRREARTVASLSHPNIVTVIDRGDYEGHQFIVFEYVEGETLKALIERDGPMPVRRALELAIQIARGLTSAHERGLIHRDVKPQNVLLNGNGEAKVTDFGIARELDVQHGMTQTGTVLGTSDYISPEQAEGRRVDEQTDVYSLGVVVYELLTGEVPFKGHNFVTVAMGHINDPPPNVLERRPDVPPRVAAAVARALAKDARDRWPSMAELRRELEACLAEAPEKEDRDEAADVTVVLPPTVDVIDAVAATAVVARRRAPRREQRGPDSRSSESRRRVRLAPLLIVAGLIVVAVALGIALALNDGGGNDKNTGASAGDRTALEAVGTFDPLPGDGSEHDAEAPRATDGNEATFWQTSGYRYPEGGLGKPGVGLVLDAREPVTLHTLTLTTDTPGFAAMIRAGDSPSGPFHDVSGSQKAAASTMFELQGAHARYFVVWITNLGNANRAHVNEVVAG